MIITERFGEYFAEIYSARDQIAVIYAFCLTQMYIYDGTF